MLAEELDAHIHHRRPFCARQCSVSIRKANDYFDDIPDVKIAPDMLKLAQHIVEQKEGAFEPGDFKDQYEEALIEVIKRKEAHQPIKKGSDRPAAPKNVVNLMDALRRSVGESGKFAKKPKKAEGQREMLMAISGSGKAKPAKTEKPTPRRKAS